MQPNPQIRTRSDLNVRDGEHYDVARSLGSSFTRSDFLDRYRVMFPQRSPGSILPSDYCFNQENKGNALYPRFLQTEGRGRFLFAGLDGNRDVGAKAPPPHLARIASPESSNPKGRTASADGTNPSELDKLMLALKADFSSVEADDYPIWGYSPPVQVIDCVLSLRRQYDAYVVPRIEAFVARHPDIRECQQLRELMGTLLSPDTLGLLTRHLDPAIWRKMSGSAPPD